MLREFYRKFYCNVVERFHILQLFKYRDFYSTQFLICRSLVYHDLSLLLNAELKVGFPKNFFDKI